MANTKKIIAKIIFAIALVANWLAKSAVPNTNENKSPIIIKIIIIDKPKINPVLIDSSNQYDLVIGSRYKTGVNVVNWPLSRLFLSYFANVYSRIITGLPIKDSTGGFKCFNINVLKSINLNKIKSSGYSFQIEMNFISWIKKYTIHEIPIIFCDRSVGESKMSKKIIFEAIYMVPLLRIKKILRIIDWFQLLLLTIMFQSI